AGEVADVALDVGVRRVLAADVEEVQAAAEVGQVAGVVPDPEGVELAVGAEAGVLDAEGGPGGLVEGDDGAVVAPGHDQGGRRDGAAGGHHGQVVGGAGAGGVLPAGLGGGDDPLQPVLV